MSELVIRVSCPSAICAKCGASTPILPSVLKLVAAPQHVWVGNEPAGRTAGFSASDEFGRPWQVAAAEDPAEWTVGPDGKRLCPSCQEAWRQFVPAPPAAPAAPAAPLLPDQEAKNPTLTLFAADSQARVEPTPIQAAPARVSALPSNAQPPARVTRNFAPPQPTASAPIAAPAAPPGMRVTRNPSARSEPPVALPVANPATSAPMLAAQPIPAPAAPPIPAPAAPPAPIPSRAPAPERSTSYAPRSEAPPRIHRSSEELKRTALVSRTAVAPAPSTVTRSAPTTLTTAVAPIPSRAKS